MTHYDIDVLKLHFLHTMGQILALPFNDKYLTGGVNGMDFATKHITFNEFGRLKWISKG